MASTSLPPLSFGDGGFRISLFGTSDETAQPLESTTEISQTASTAYSIKSFDSKPVAEPKVEEASAPSVAGTEGHESVTSSGSGFQIKIELEPELRQASESAAAATAVTEEAAIETKEERTSEDHSAENQHMDEDTVPQAPPARHPGRRVEAHLEANSSPVLQHKSPQSPRSWLDTKSEEQASSPRQASVNQQPQSPKPSEAASASLPSPAPAPPSVAAPSPPTDPAPAPPSNVPASETASDAGPTSIAIQVIEHEKEIMSEQRLSISEPLATPTSPNESQPAIPTHPVPSMQAAFAESLFEVTNGVPNIKPKLKALDADSRRLRLLDQAAHDRPYDELWRYRPGQKQHEVFKLISEISFGVYLLLNGLANNNSEVVTILQGHIDEVDEFLEVVLEDQTEATTDIKDRMGHLKLPMANPKTFEQLLEDRNYRAEILLGNEKIEHILARTTAAVKQWNDDVDKGLTSSLTFQAWLRGLNKDGTVKPNTEMSEILEAMQGNAEGWLNAFDEMNRRSETLKGLITEFTVLLSDIEQKAGEVSRKTWAHVQPYSSPASSIRDSSSIRSPHSSGRGLPKSKSRTSMRTTPNSNMYDDLDEYPLPGAAPMLPPARSTSRPRLNGPTHSGGKLHVDTALSSHPPTVAEDDESQTKGATEDGPLYILQPRTYTPQPPEPLPSPMLKNSPIITSSDGYRQSNEDAQSFQRRASIRDRVSLRTDLPQDIRIPSSVRSYGHQRRPSSSHGTPRTINSNLRDSYGSEASTPHQRHGSRGGSFNDMSPPQNRPSLMPSPRSDHQYFSPVRASPHSPLQQRPHTSGPGAQSPHGSYHQRNQPSRLGGMSTLSRMTLAANEEPPMPSASTATQAGDKRLKKKKSAFGWFKKAFSMDDEERAAFESRKYLQPQAQNYYDNNSPRWLDGRRVR